MALSGMMPAYPFQAFCMQMWSVESALLLASCRGHQGEVTDLAVNADNSIVASSSNDTVIRCWSLLVGLAWS